jgi:NitT/TauT family transport system ATP-binding protein
MTALQTRPSSGGVSQTKPLLHVDHVTKRFSNDVVALFDVSLDIHAGEFVSLLGPSGCGKSTLLGLIGGLGSPSEGTIDWPQSAPNAAGGPERSIGIVFQEPTLLPWRTVFENVYLPLKLAGVSREAARDQIMDGLAQVGLSAFANSYPRQLSGGMKMRTSIARALIRQPKILLMDEPFAALDEITRTNLSLELLDVFSRSKLTVIFVTHSVYESVFLSNRIVVMTARPGKILADYPIEEPYPRTDEYRTSVAYNEYCRKVSASLKEALRSGPSSNT